MITVSSRVASSLIYGAIVTAVIGVLTFLHYLSQPALASGDACPEFRFRTIDGRLLARDDLTGRSAVLLFLHPSCQLCRSTVSRLCAAPREPNGEVILVSLANADATQKFAQSVCSLGTWAWGEKEAARSAFGIRNLPTMVLVRSNGKVAHVSIGPYVSSDFSRYFGLHEEASGTEKR